MRTSTLFVCVVILLFVNIAFLTIFYVNQNTAQKSTEIVKKIVELKDVNLQSPLVIDLLKLNGVEATQDLLLKSGLPFTGESHLLVHTVGNYIYDTLDNGLSHCKDYFLSACYHAYIIRDLADNGVDGVAQTVEKCASAGVHVLAQCSHASGHGFLAWTDYDIPKALSMCDQIQETFNEIPTFNCYDGVFMENIYGVHEGSPSPKRWVKTEDFYYPCNDSQILDKYKLACWANQATLVYIESHEDFDRVISVCDSAPTYEYMRMCYNNYARQIHPLTYGKYAAGQEFCNKASTQEWVDYCEISLLHAAYSVGDRTTMPFEICRGINSETTDACYEALIDDIASYSPTNVEIQKQCNLIENEEYKNVCLTKLGKS
jgi:hypothetical protein